EKQVHELFARQAEDEVVLGLALPLSAGAAIFGRRPRNAITRGVAVIAGMHDLAVAALAVAERRLGDVLDRHLHLAALLHVGDRAPRDQIVDRAPDLVLVAAQEAAASER